jgi:hypothetical protein
VNAAGMSFRVLTPTNAQQFVKVEVIPPKTQSSFQPTRRQSSLQPKLLLRQHFRARSLAPLCLRLRHSFIVSSFLFRVCQFLTPAAATVTIEGTSFTYDPTNFEIPDFQFDVPDEAEWANAEVLETIMRSNAAPIPSLGTTFDTPPLEAHRPQAANWNGSLPNSADPGLNAVAIAPPVLHAPIPEALANAPVVQHAPVLDVAAPISTISNMYAAAPNGAHAPISPSSINPPAPATSPVVVPPGTLVQDTPATVVAVTPPPTNVAVVEPPPAPQPASGLPPMAATSVLASIPLAVHASPANAPPVAPTSMPLPALPLRAPAATPPSFQCGHSNAGTQVAAHPSGTTMPTTWSATLSVNANAAPGLSPPFNLHVPNNNMPAFDPGLLKTSDHQQQDRAPFQDVDYDIRRSGRAPVPSTRLEKLNEIGDNIPPSRPPPDTHGEPEEPAWFAPAYKHLKNSSLGPEWDTLVEKWAGYERMKGWKSGKVCIQTSLWCRSLS